MEKTDLCNLLVVFYVSKASIVGFCSDRCNFFSFSSDIRLPMAYQISDTLDSVGIPCSSQFCLI